MRQGWLLINSTSVVGWPKVSPQRYMQPPRSVTLDLNIISCDWIHAYPFIRGKWLVGFSRYILEHVRYTRREQS